MEIILKVFRILSYINILFAVTIIFLERKDASSTWAWLMILVLVPGVGFILYLLLGQNLSRQKIFDVKAEEDTFHKELLFQGKQLEENHMNFYDKNAVKYKDMMYMHLNNSQSVFSQDNKVNIYTQGDELFDSLITSIKNAKDHIHMVYYIVKNDTIGNKILHELAKKASEGVEIRFLYDEMGCRKLPKHFFDELKKFGGKVSVFFPSILPHINIRVNFRNHRKIVVIDGVEAFIGGFNIGDEYLGKNETFGYWRDTHLKITGSAVNSLQQRFLLDWRHASNEKISFDKKYFPPKTPYKGVGIQIVSSGPDSEWEQIKNGYLKMIHSAKKSVYIHSPYLVPDESITEALKIASLSGVKVKVMIPNKPDHPFVYWASLSCVGELLKAGVECYTYNKGFLHSKMVVIDGKVSSVGTANMDIRSFKLNFEVNAFLYDSTISHSLEKIFEKDILDCTEITKDHYKNRPLIVKFKESISRLLSPIL